jgi:hypothetical protein
MGSPTPSMLTVKKTVAQSTRVHPADLNLSSVACSESAFTPNNGHVADEAALRIGPVQVIRAERDNARQS